jgi:hypothetical protein
MMTQFASLSYSMRWLLLLVTGALISYALGKYVFKV